MFLANKPLVVKRVSASQVKSFRACSRRWWFSKVAKIPEPGSAATLAGTMTHALIEGHFISVGDWPSEADFNTLKVKELAGLKKRGLDEDTLAKADRETQYNRCLSWAKTLATTYPDPTGKEKVELPFSLASTVPGVSISGFIDLVRFDWTDKDKWHVHIIDHKTTSDLKWVPDVEDLKTTIQPLIYHKAAKAAWSAQRFTVNFTYVDKKKQGKVYPRTFQYTPEEAATLWQSVNSTIADMVAAGLKTNSDDVAPNTNACNSYGKRCPFFDKCSPAKATTPKFGGPKMAHADLAAIRTELISRGFSPEDLDGTPFLKLKVWFRKGKTPDEVGFTSTAPPEAPAPTGAQPAPEPPAPAPTPKAAPAPAPTPKAAPTPANLNPPGGTPLGEKTTLPDSKLLSMHLVADGGKTLSTALMGDLKQALADHFNASPDAINKARLALKWKASEMKLAILHLQTDRADELPAVLAAELGLAAADVGVDIVTATEATVVDAPVVDAPVVGQPASKAAPKTNKAKVTVSATLVVGGEPDVVVYSGAFPSWGEMPADLVTVAGESIEHAGAAAGGHYGLVDYAKGGPTVASHFRVAIQDGRVTVPPRVSIDARHPLGNHLIDAMKAAGLVVGVVRGVV